MTISGRAVRESESMWEYSGKMSAFFKVQQQTPENARTLF